jgi:hypothetical protein
MAKIRNSIVHQDNSRKDKVSQDIDKEHFERYFH